MSSIAVALIIEFVAIRKKNLFCLLQMEGKLEVRGGFPDPCVTQSALGLNTVPRDQNLPGKNGFAESEHAEEGSYSGLNYWVPLL